MQTLVFQEQELLRVTAEKCRDAYIVHRQAWESTHNAKKQAQSYKPGVKWDGGTDPEDGRVYKPVWDSLAKFVLKHRLDPYEMMATRFKIAAAVRHAPFPNQIACDRYLESYRGDQPICSTSTLKSTKLSEFEFCAVEMLMTAEGYGGSKRDLWLTVLLNPKIALSALSRYCIAANAGIGEVLEAVYGDAAAQYMLCPDQYDQAWFDVLPDDFRQSARRLYARVVGGGV